MQRKTQERKPKNLGQFDLGAPKKDRPPRVEIRWYRPRKTGRWLKVQFNPDTGKIRPSYGIWLTPPSGSELVTNKPTNQTTTTQATVKILSDRLAIPKPEDTKQVKLKELLEQKALERKTREINKHNIYVMRNLRK